MEQNADNKENQDKLLEVLQEKFGAEMVSNEPSEDERRFLKERYELEQMIWTLELYFYYYDLLKTYGLEQKILEELEWNIIWQLENNKNEFLKSVFYKKFKGHDSVQKAKTEYERRNWNKL